MYGRDLGGYRVEKRSRGCDDSLALCPSGTTGGVQMRSLLRSSIPGDESYLQGWYITPEAEEDKSVV